ncbi:hypothetical protein EDD17DRAFT_1040823 [Pisolithus thermaeus]|nr:hypothetical protein EDD17DRAFT_1040823 [Pisolithus thermaeus]
MSAYCRKSLRNLPKHLRHHYILPIIQDIKALQVKLNATQNEGEQRALDEEITGKILWLFWCGTRVEVDELLAKGLLNMCSLMESTTCTDPEDDQALLRRIMLAAGQGPSKHSLWAAAHIAEQAKWSSTAGHTSTIDIQSGTSRPRQ